MSNTNSGKFRKKRVYYSQVSNYALRDNNLSLKAKGLYALIQSYITIENFILYKSYLITLCSEGKQAFNSSWNELKNKGYLIQYKIKSKKGYFTYEYELLDKPFVNPDTENRYVDNPDMDKQDMELLSMDSQDIENQDDIKNIKNKNDNNNTNIIKKTNFDYEENRWYKTFREKTNKRINLYQLRAIVEESSKHQNNYDEFIMNDNEILNGVLHAYHYILNTKKEEVLINNKHIPIKFIKEKILLYTFDDFINIIRTLSATNSEKITNLNYFIAVLINYSP